MIWIKRGIPHPQIMPARIGRRSPEKGWTSRREG